MLGHFMDWLISDKGVMVVFFVVVIVSIIIKAFVLCDVYDLVDSIDEADVVDKPTARAKTAPAPSGKLVA